MSKHISSWISCEWVLISGTKERWGSCPRRSGNGFDVLFSCAQWRQIFHQPPQHTRLSVAWIWVLVQALLLASTKLGRTGRSTFADLNQAVLYGPSHSHLYLLQEPTDSLEDSLLSSKPEFIIGHEGEEEENPAARHGENPGTRTAPSENAGRWTWLMGVRFVHFLVYTTSATWKSLMVLL